MKRYIKSSSERPYLYIFKHGIGPGTLPRDVEVIKTKDLPNYYTAVWLDRFLTTDELRQYDIPSETRINELLGRIGYCQKDGDVVPCDEVEACMSSTSITSSTSISIREIAEEIHSYFKETGAEDSTNSEILKYLSSKGYDVSDVTNSEIDEAWDLQASWWDEYENEEDDGSVVLNDGMKIKDKEQAYIWLQENIEQYGNTYFWDSSLKNDLNRLIERFGNTYFWRS